MIGISQLKLGRQADAVSSFERATAANPKDSWASDLLGRARPVTLPADTSAARPPPLPYGSFTKGDMTFESRRRGGAISTAIASG